MKAIRLRTEYLERPLGLGIRTPRFYWNCESGRTQTAYQIVCRRQDAVIWDSGKVASAAMTHIRYAGEPLRSRDQVTWTVTLWDENDCVGEPAESTLEMGLLEPGDWSASWIAGDYRPRKTERYPVDLFRRTFTASGEIRQARLYAAARGVYDVTINGSRIEVFILAPGMTDYRRRIQYQTYDVTAMLAQENTIELGLADGWYRGSSAAYGATGVYGWQTSVIAQLEITYADGRTETVVTDGSWDWCNDGPIRSADLKDGEVYNAQMTPSWSGHAQVVSAPKAPLVASDNVPVREQERLPMRPLTHQVWDSGQNLAGYVEFCVHGEPGETIRLVCGELLDADGQVDLSNIQESVSARRYSNMDMMRKLMTGKAAGTPTLTPLQEIRFTCSGGEDHYKTRFAVFGFRYVQVIGNAQIRDLTAIAVYSDMAPAGTFACSNEQVNQLVHNTLWSMKSNHLDLPTDCPTRERLGWTGDAQIFFHTGAYLMDTAAFYRKWIRDMEDAQYPNGLLPAVLPYQGVEMMYKTTGQSVGWADAVYLIPYRYYQRYGDRSLLEACYPMMRRYAEYLRQNLGMVDRKAAKANPYNAFTYEKGMHLGEWLEPEEFQEHISAGKRPRHPEEATAYLYLAMTTMAEIAGILGNEADRKVYQEYADGSKAAYRHLFADTLDTNRQAKLVRPLAFDLLGDEEKAYAQRRLLQAVETANYHVGTGFLSTPFLLGVLTEAGQAETAYRVLENTERPGWLYEVGQGATTVWESWEGNISHNHYSPGAVCQWLFDTVAGIRQDGENHFLIQPIPGGTLTHARASYRSLYGLAESGWERRDGETCYTVTIPANTTARLILPDGSSRDLEAGTYTYTI